MSGAPRWPVELPTRLRPLRVISDRTDATVWEVTDAATGHGGVVKVARAGALDELRALARLNGTAGIAPIIELGSLRSGGTWMLSPLQPGGTLLDRVGTEPPSAIELMGWGERLFSALAAAHALDVVHGDVSPNNIVIDPAGLPMLVDFGSTTVDGGSGRVGGFTPAVAAPERLQGAGADRPSDVYALSATLEWALQRSGAGPRCADLAQLLAPGTDEVAARRPTAAAFSASLRSALASPE